jgi:CheY-like chemotaxis protein
MSRSVALVDSDTNLANHLYGELGRYGFAVESLGTADDLMARQEHLPDVIVLCIDPKRTGWAVCNRLRKSANVKGIPLIVTSAEATEKDFEDHKKLKTRAEDYLHKPFAADALVQKIADLVGMPEAQPEVIDIAVEPDEEIQVEEEAALIEENGQSFDGGLAASFDGEEHTRVAPLNLMDETDNAFAAISENHHDAAMTPVRPPPTAAHDDPFSFKDSPFDVEEHDSGTAPGSEPLVDALDLGLDAVAEEAKQRPRRQSSPLINTPAAAKDSSLMLELRAERDKLAREVEELKARPAPAPAPSKAEGFSREREFLNLREVINRKEKELLDLRDSLDAKDRQILDGKDKLRELERRHRDVDDKLLNYEKELVAANERIEAAAGDKQLGGEREKQLKARIDDALKQLKSYEHEIEDLKANATNAAEAHANELRVLGERAATEKRILGEQAANEQESLRLQLESAASESAEQHEQILAAARQAHSDEVSGVRARAAQDLKLSQEAHAAAMTAREGELRGELAALANRHEDALKARELAASAEADRLRNEHIVAVEALQTSHAGALAESENALKEAHEAKLTEELGKLRDSHTTKLAALEESHADVKAGMQARHMSERSDLEATIGERDTQLAEARTQVGDLTTQLATVRQSESALQAQVASLNTAIGERDAGITERNTRISELEQESAAFQDQILKAYQRIKNEETNIARAKKALAIALTLLDEAEGSDEAKT